MLISVTEAIGEVVIGLTEIPPDSADLFRFVEDRSVLVVVVVIPRQPDPGPARFHDECRSSLEGVSVHGRLDGLFSRLFNGDSARLIKSDSIGPFHARQRDPALLAVTNQRRRESRLEAIEGPRAPSEVIRSKTSGATHAAREISDLVVGAVHGHLDGQS